VPSPTNAGNGGGIGSAGDASVQHESKIASSDEPTIATTSQESSSSSSSSIIGGTSSCVLEDEWDILGHVRGDDDES
jgi:hypothetical protein